jgi:hypothetical protein
MAAHPIPLRLTVFEILSSRELSPRGIRRLAGDEHGHVWDDAPVRHRPHYVCSAGVEHTRWWRLHTPGGGPEYPRELRCIEHEVTEVISPDLVEI